MFDNRARAVSIVLAAAIWPAAAAAQDAPADDLMQLGTTALRQEIGQRYDAALAMSRDAAVISADSNRYMWASQAKAQCGIALGFLKSGAKDPVSVGKCADAYARMQAAQAALPPPPQLAPAPVSCGESIAGIVFFDWDSAIPPASASETINSVVSGLGACQWSSLTVTGHTDRSGSDPYNDALSLRRANAVADLLGGKGVNPAQIQVAGRGESEPKVPTPDGERNPTNRRVEINVR